MLDDLSVVIANWNGAELLKQCLAPLEACGALEVVVVDNASSDGSVEVVGREFPSVKVICNAANVGFARASNQGIAASGRRLVLLLNSDTVVKPAALLGLVEFLEEHPDAGAVGPRLLQPNGEPQPFAFGSDPTLGYLARRGMVRLLLGRGVHDWRTSRTRTVDWVSGACMLLRRRALEQVGALDEHMFMYFEDNELCLRLRKAGWKVCYHPRVEITHRGGCSRKKNPDAEGAYYRSLDYFYAKHYNLLARLVLRLGLMPRRVLGRR